MARLFLDTLFKDREAGNFAIHAFVLMPDHFHAILTPSFAVSLEKAVQFIKGEFSFRAKRELQYVWDIWEPSFTNHRIRDAIDFERHLEYIAANPLRAGLRTLNEDYPYSFRGAGFMLDPPPPGLKPHDVVNAMSPG